MSTATFTSPGQQEIIDILKAAHKGMTSREIFAKAKGFEDADAVSKALNYAMKKGVVEREKVAQNTYAYWLASAKASDTGNTLLRGTDGREEVIPDIPATATGQNINAYDESNRISARIDATTQAMADQAEQAYQTLSEALGLTPNQMCDMTLTDLASTAAALLADPLPHADADLQAAAMKLSHERLTSVIDVLRKAPVPFAALIDNGPLLVSCVEAIGAELIGEQVRASSQAELLGRICHTLEISPHSTEAEILAEVENISRPAQRNIQTSARDATQGPYLIITSHRGGPIECLDKAKKFAESVARETPELSAAIVRIVTDVEMKPVWSDAV